MVQIGTQLQAPRVMALPEGVADPGVPLEFVHWTLYSAIALAGGTTLPRQVEAFNYLIGQTVAGAGGAAIAATGYHTNVQAVRTLPRPSVLIVDAVRLIIPPAAYATSPDVDDDTVAAAAANLDGVDDLTLITQSMTATFDVGNKTYIDGCPIWMLPANVGIGGIHATAVANGAAASTAVQKRAVVNAKGREWRFNRGDGIPPIIQNGETFRFELRCDWTTNPSIVDDRLIFVHLDGRLGRAVQ